MGLSIKGMLSSAIVAAANAVIFTVVARKVGEHLDKKNSPPQFKK